MEDHKELFYMKLLEYVENLPKHYDKEKFVLSGLRYEAILNCLDKEKGHKTEACGYQISSFIYCPVFLASW
jgi:hypothetical protein